MTMNGEDSDGGDVADIKADWPCAWRSLGWPDISMLGFTAVHQVFLLGVILHLVRNRNWPPYVTKNVTLVAATGVGSSVSLVGGLLAYGVINREAGDFLAQCGMETMLTSLGTALQFFPAFVRVYRNYTLLVLHSAAMWSGMVQLQAVSLPYLVPAFIYLVKPTLVEFEEYRNRCFVNVWIDLVGFLYMAVGISCAIVLVARMRTVRKQLNEFRVMTTSLAFLLVWALYLHPTGQWFWVDNPNVARRLVMLDNFVSTVVLFWCPIAIPFLRHLQKDEEYVSQFTFGFSMLPTPGQMRASLADQLGVEDLRRKFRKYAAGRVAPELPDFYKACMDREQLEGYFERQAMTMAIVDRFVSVGAEQEINISQECKQRVLNAEITRYNIFDEAIAEVLHVMEVNFKADFERTREFRSLCKAVEREAEELDVLRQARLVPQPKEEGEQWPRPSSRAWRGGRTQASTPVDDGLESDPEACGEGRRHSFSTMSSTTVSPPMLRFPSPFVTTSASSRASAKSSGASFSSALPRLSPRSATLRVLGLGPRLAGDGRRGGGGGARGSGGSCGCRGGAALVGSRRDGTGGSGAIAAAREPHQWPFESSQDTRPSGATVPSSAAAVATAAAVNDNRRHSAGGRLGGGGGGGCLLAQGLALVRTAAGRAILESKLKGNVADARGAVTAPSSTVYDVSTAQDSAAAGGGDTGKAVKDAVAGGGLSRAPRHSSPSWLSARGARNAAGGDCGGGDAGRPLDGGGNGGGGGDGVDLEDLEAGGGVDVASEGSASRASQVFASTQSTLPSEATAAKAGLRRGDPAAVAVGPPLPRPRLSVKADAAVSKFRRASSTRASTTSDAERGDLAVSVAALSPSATGWRPTNIAHLSSPMSSRGAGLSPAFRSAPTTPDGGGWTPSRPLLTAHRSGTVRGRRVCDIPSPSRDDVDMVLVSSVASFSPLHRDRSTMTPPPAADAGTTPPACGGRGVLNDPGMVRRRGETASGSRRWRGDARVESVDDDDVEEHRKGVDSRSRRLGRRDVEQRKNGRQGVERTPAGVAGGGTIDRNRDDFCGRQDDGNNDHDDGSAVVNTGGCFSSSSGVSAAAVCERSGGSRRRPRSPKRRDSFSSRSRSPRRGGKNATGVVSQSPPAEWSRSRLRSPNTGVRNGGRTMSLPVRKVKPVAAAVVNWDTEGGKKCSSGRGTSVLSSSTASTAVPSALTMSTSTETATGMERGRRGRAGDRGGGGYVYGSSSESAVDPKPAPCSRCSTSCACRASPSSVDGDQAVLVQSNAATPTPGGPRREASSTPCSSSSRAAHGGRSRYSPVRKRAWLANSARSASPSGRHAASPSSSSGGTLVSSVSYTTVGMATCIAARSCSPCASRAPHRLGGGSRSIEHGGGIDGSGSGVVPTDVGGVVSLSLRRQSLSSSSPETRGEGGGGYVAPSSSRGSGEVVAREGGRSRKVDHILRRRPIVDARSLPSLDTRRGEECPGQCIDGVPEGAGGGDPGAGARTGAVAPLKRNNALGVSIPPINWSKSLPLMNRGEGSVNGEGNCRSEGGSSPGSRGGSSSGGSADSTVDCDYEFLFSRQPTMASTTPPVRRSKGVGSCNANGRLPEVGEMPQAGVVASSLPIEICDGDRGYSVLHEGVGEVSHVATEGPSSAAAVVETRNIESFLGSGGAGAAVVAPRQRSSVPLESKGRGARRGGEDGGVTRFGATAAAGVLWGK